MNPANWTTYRSSYDLDSDLDFDQKGAINANASIIYESNAVGSIDNSHVTKPDSETQKLIENTLDSKGRQKEVRLYTHIDKSSDELEYYVMGQLSNSDVKAGISKQCDALEESIEEAVDRVLN